jgi:hypothetical protein
MYGRRLESIFAPDNSIEKEYDNYERKFYEKIIGHPTRGPHSLATVSKNYKKTKI